MFYNGCEVLDFAGPLQTFSEANAGGAKYEVVLCATTTTIRTAQQIVVADLQPLPEPRAADIVLVPGFPLKQNIPASLPKWLRRAAEKRAHICSVCTGAFLLGQAGLLDKRNCTTHWKRVDELQAKFPDARVLSNRLFVHDRNITSSAGIASGIDMALWLVEQHYGPLLAAKVAREMVVYIRRDGQYRQESVYLDYRTHLSPGIHQVQDWITAHPEAKANIAALARIARMSPRNLTRTFKQATGVSIHEFRTRIRVELARSLMRNPELKLDAIAERCGFSDGRSLRRAYHAQLGTLPKRIRGSKQISRAR